MWFYENFYKYTVGIILVLIIILLLYQTAPVFAPILWFITAVLLPILFAVLLFYILRPLVNLLAMGKIPRYLAILIVYMGIAAVTAFVVLVVAPKFVEDIRFMSDIQPGKIESLKTQTKELVERLKSYIPETELPALEQVLYSYLQKANAFIYQLAYNTISTLANIAIALALTPFVLFYFLRDGDLFAHSILRFVPLQYQEETQNIFRDIDETLSGFILAQLTIALMVGFFLLCGYSLIGLPQAVGLSLFAMVFYVIPILGTFIALIPALIIGLSISFGMALKILIVMFLAHFLEANLLTPRIMSQRLQIHPLTIILLLLAAGSLYGLLGLLLVTPTYAILKVIVSNIYKISRLRIAAHKA